MEGLVARHLLLQRQRQNNLPKFEMEKVINLGIPHVGENIFDNIDTEELIQCLFVSQNWRVLVANVLLQRYSLLEACRDGKTIIVQLYLERQKLEDFGRIFLHKCIRGWTIFMIACFNGHKDIVKLLLDMLNIELNARNDFGDTAFILA